MKPRTQNHLDDLAERFTKSSGAATPDPPRVHHRRPVPRPAKLRLVLLIAGILLALALGVAMILDSFGG